MFKGTFTALITPFNGKKIDAAAFEKPVNEKVSRVLVLRDEMPKTLEDYTKEELIDIIKGLQRRKKFGLVWEYKPERARGPAPRERL